MRYRNTTPRYRAQPTLRERIQTQGRRSDWLAHELGISRSHMSKIISGHRCLNQTDARVLAALLGGGFSVLFELSNGTENVSHDAVYSSVAT